MKPKTTARMNFGVSKMKRIEQHEIDKDDFESYFEDISKFIKNQQIELGVFGLEIGDQIESEWAQLDGISYEPKTDTLFVHTKYVDHAITGPQQVLVAESREKIHAISVKDADRRSHVLQFRSPLLLENNSHIHKRILDGLKHSGQMHY
jgi:hypothetical protein